MSRNAADLPRGQRLLPCVSCTGLLIHVYRVMALVEAPPRAQALVRRLELAHGEPSLAAAVVMGVRGLEHDGQRVVGIRDGRGRPIVTAADLVLRLRELSAVLSEEDLLVLLELLPL